MPCRFAVDFLVGAHRRAHTYTATPDTANTSTPTDNDTIADTNSTPPAYHHTLSSRNKPNKGLNIRISVDKSISGSMMTAPNSLDTTATGGLVSQSCLLIDDEHPQQPSTTPIEHHVTVSTFCQPYLLTSIHDILKHDKTGNHVTVPILQGLALCISPPQSTHHDSLATLHAATPDSPSDLPLLCLTHLLKAARDHVLPSQSTHPLACLPFSLLSLQRHQAITLAPHSSSSQRLLA